MPAPLSRLSARAALRLRNEPMSPSPSARRLSARAIKIDSPRQWHPPCVRGTGTQHHDGRRAQLSGRVPRVLFFKSHTLPRDPPSPPPSCASLLTPLLIWPAPRRATKQCKIRTLPSYAYEVSIQSLLRGGAEAGSSARRVLQQPPEALRSRLSASIRVRALLFAAL